MCLACEQDAMWFAYLRRRGLIDENGMPTEPAPFLADAFDTLATEEEKEAKAAQSAAPSADQQPPRPDEPKAE
jgi:hypothetical protein